MVKRVAVILNPAKQVDPKRVREIIEERSTELGWAEPLWFETSKQEPGTSQAHEAVKAGVEAVIVGGGDGTVRAAADGLAGTGVPMVLLPLGTGNLLARNLPIPHRADLPERIEPAFTGRDHDIDVGWLRLHRQVNQDPVDQENGDEESRGDAASSKIEVAPARAEDHLMLVIAGLGFGADIMAHTDEKLKRKVGWLAYFVAGAKNWRGKRTRVLLSVDGQDPVRRRQRTVLVGNCGKIMGGLTLLPDAVIDDGLLDIAVIDPRGGVWGWTRLFGEVVRQGLRRRTTWPPDRTIDHEPCRKMTVISPTPQQIQIDGDIIGTAHGFSSWVDPGALTMRLP